MGSSLRCKVTGHDLDECGICKRCGSEDNAGHDWKEAAERKRPCFKLSVCERCGSDREIADHDWQMSEGGPQGIMMTCSRCGLKI
ncbi:MAG: hypothetical protein R3344_07415 [Acidobacteriota bacterium]|nr:hypothetical protein [Acidobacteriota bacterium]